MSNVQSNYSHLMHCKNLAANNAQRSPIKSHLVARVTISPRQLHDGLVKNYSIE